MNPPANSIRAELNNALVGGIRQRGAEAVGLVLVGGAHLLLALLALLLAEILGAVVFDREPGSTASIAILLISAVSTAAISGRIRRNSRR